MRGAPGSFTRIVNDILAASPRDFGAKIRVPCPDDGPLAPVTWASIVHFSRFSHLLVSVKTKA